MVYPDNRMVFSVEEKMSYQAVKRHVGTLNMCYCLREVNMKMLYTGWFPTFWKRQTETILCDANRIECTLLSDLPNVKYGFG